MKPIAYLIAVALGPFFMPGLAWLVPVIWWAVVVIVTAALGTATTFFVQRRLQRRFPVPFNQRLGYSKLESDLMRKTL